ncbi:MAG: radical SAM protein [Proteobacteria bacterium]|nr:radical SAM protein [Pseudomonadota bacterium]
MTTVVPSRTASVRGTSDSDPIVGDRVELQLLTTLKCNLKCTYCSLEVGEVLGSQAELEYDIDQLSAFVDRHLIDKEVYVTFYGGEPTLNCVMIESVMQRFPAYRFQLQTNGTLLDDLPVWVLAKLSNILVSIDGGKEITDNYRGRGIWSQVIRNVRHVRDKIGGTVTARVTWGNPDTTFEELDDLAGVFDYLHWQFVADEMYFGDSLAKRKAVLIQLIDRFFAQTDEIYPVIPLMGIVRNKLFPNWGRELYADQTQCRVSTHLINVMPSGKIYPCPDMMYVPEMQMGEIQGNWLKRSPLQPTHDMPCPGCEAFAWCRRNCLKNLYLGYARNDERYRRNVVEPICDLLRFMGREIDRRNPREWFSRLAVSMRQRLLASEIYDYVEIMP